MADPAGYVSPGLGPIYDRCLQLFTALSDAFAARPVPPFAPPPGRQVILDGGAVPEDWDAILAVGLASARLGFPGVPELIPITAATGVVVDLAAWVYRPSPVSDDEGSPPSPVEIGESARIIYADMWTVLGTILSGQDDLSLFGHTKASVPQIKSIGPGGGIVGFQADLQVELS